MNKRVLVLFVVLIAVILAFRFCNSRPETKIVEEKPLPLAVSANSPSFNESFHQLLSSYFALKDAFIAGDTSQVNAASKIVQVNADSLKVGEVRGDTSGTITETVKYFAATIGSSAKAVQGEKELEAKRSEFNMITDALWGLTRTVKYDQQKIYYQFCSQAFDNRGAYWLSDKRDSKNPYFGSKMPDCSEVADSLDYSKR